MCADARGGAALAHNAHLVHALLAFHWVACVLGVKKECVGCCCCGERREGLWDQTKQTGRMRETDAV